MADLEGFARGLDETSRKLALLESERDIEESWYAEEAERFTATLWAQYVHGEIRAWPGEGTREALLHAELRSRDRETGERLVKLGLLRARRKKIAARLEDIRTGISARQSLLNALRTELEATR
jgi:hypothetical protein